MLPDLKKLVGRKTAEESEIEKYKLLLQEHPREAPKIHLELGKLYEKIANKGAAIEAYAMAARLYANAGDTSMAIIANKLIAQLDPKNRDALANLAYLHFQGGSERQKKEYQQFLQEIEEPQQEQQEVSLVKAKKPKILDKGERNVHNAFDADRMALVDLIEGKLDVTDDRVADRKIPVDLGKEKAKVTDDRGPDQEILIDLREGQTKVSDERDGDKKIPVDFPAKLPYAPEEIISYLKQIPLFSKLSHKEFRRIAQDVHIHRIIEHTLVMEGEKQPQSVVLTLMLKIECSQETQASPFVITLGTGDSLGEHGFLNQDDIAFAAATKSASTLVEISGTVPIPPAGKYPAIVDSFKRVCRQRCFGPTLARIPLFSHLTAKERETIMEYFLTENVKKGTVIIAEGERDESIYLIQSGEVEVSTTLIEREELQVIQAEQKQIRLFTLQAGDFFGEEAFLTKEPRTITVSACSDAQLLKLPQRYLAGLISDYPQVGKLLEQYYQQRTAEMMRIMQAAISGKP
jgi:CRP-like cAMP-binding protein